MSEKHKQQVTDCNGLITNFAENGNSERVIYNGAKMYEALEKIKECYENDYLSLDRDPGDVLGNAALLAENALAAPPRNCDRYNSMEDAMRTFIDAIRKLYGKVEFGDAEWVAFFRWLFDEAKGTNENA